MNFSILLPIGLGCIGILQGAVNRQVANYIGVTQATLIGNTMTFVIAVIFYLLVKNNVISVPNIFLLKAPVTTFKWWFIIPAIFGFLIVAGMPWAIVELGAVKVTVGLIAAQMVTSVIWDIAIEGMEMGLYKIIGIIFAFLSVGFITFSK